MSSGASTTSTIWKLARSRLEKQAFEEDAVHLFAENAVAGERNGFKVGRQAVTVSGTVLRVASRDSSQAASRATYDMYGQVRRVVHLARGAPVMLISNLRTSLGLVNGAVGKVVAVELREGAEADDGGLRGAVSADKVRYVVVDFPQYNGPAIWPDHPKWVPVAPCSTRHKKKKQWERFQLPLALAWGMTIHKSQGLTFTGRVVVDFAHQPTYQPVAKPGLAFVGMSRCTDFALQAFRNLPGF